MENEEVSGLSQINAMNMKRVIESQIVEVKHLKIRIHEKGRELILCDYKTKLAEYDGAHYDESHPDPLNARRERIRNHIEQMTRKRERIINNLKHKGVADVE